MSKWVLGLVVILLAVSLILGWRVLFPTPEQVIRTRLAALAHAACFTSNESPLAKLANSQKVTTFCTADVELQLDVPGRSQHAISGRDELLQAVLAARNTLPGLSVEFMDIEVALAPDRQSAVVGLTAKGKVPGERDLYLQELKLVVKKIEGDWLIQRVETVKTLL